MRSRILRFLILLIGAVWGGSGLIGGLILFKHSTFFARELNGSAFYVSATVAALGIVFGISTIFVFLTRSRISWQLLLWETLLLQLFGAITIFVVFDKSPHWIRIGGILFGLLGFVPVHVVALLLYRDCVADKS